MPKIEIGVNEKGQTREQALWSRLREERDRRIAETDYMAMGDYPIDPDRLEAVKAYRQALRDITKQDGAPWDGGGSQTPWPALE